MQTWFNCKVKYVKVDDTGKEKKVTEPYLVDAVSFSEAETRIHKILEPYIRGGLEIASLSKANIEEVFDFDDDGVWYKAKITYLDVDPDTEKKKKITNYVLVKASDVKNAYERVEESMSLLVPYDMPVIQETPILDIFPYESDPEKALEGRNTRPLAEDERVNRITGEIEKIKTDDTDIDSGEQDDEGYMEED